MEKLKKNENLPRHGHRSSRRPRSWRLLGRICRRSLSMSTKLTKKSEKVDLFSFLLKFLLCLFHKTLKIGWVLLSFLSIKQYYFFLKIPTYKSEVSQSSVIQIRTKIVLRCKWTWVWHIKRPLNVFLSFIQVLKKPSNVNSFCIKIKICL